MGQTIYHEISFRIKESRSAQHALMKEKSSTALKGLTSNAVAVRSRDVQVQEKLLSCLVVPTQLWCLLLRWLLLVQWRPLLQWLPLASC
jgi:hypothetical protein